MKRVLLCIPIILMLFVGCEDKLDELEHESENDIFIPPSKGNPGLGDSDEAPLGAALVLPEGIRIVERKHHPFDQDIRKLYAHANFFYVDVNFVNDRMPGTPSVTVEFPPGVIVESRDHDKQNGLSIEKYLIEVPPTERLGGGRDTTTIYIGMACLNESRSMPWYDNIGEEQRFPISRNNYEKFIVTSDPGLLKLLSVLKGHPGLKVTQHWDPVAAHEEDYVVPEWMKIHGEIQEYIWDITDRHGLTYGKISKLKQKLEAYK